MAPADPDRIPDSQAFPPAAEVAAPFRICAAEHVANPDPGVADTARQAFDIAQGLALTEAVDPALLATLLRLSAAATFEPQEVTGLGRREVEAPDRVGAAVRMVLSRPALLRWLETAADCGPLGGVQGQLVRMGPGGGLTWHKDSGHDVRRLAVVLNLTQAAYEGGRFEMRRRHIGTPLMAYDHRVAGGLTIFRIDRTLEHRVLPVLSGGPRTVFAGWFLRPLTDGERVPARH